MQGQQNDPRLSQAPRTPLSAEMPPGCQVTTGGGTAQGRAQLTGATMHQTTPPACLVYLKSMKNGTGRRDQILLLLLPHHHLPAKLSANRRRIMYVRMCRVWACFLSAFPNLMYSGDSMVAAVFYKPLVLWRKGVTATRFGLWLSSVHRLA